MNSEIFSLLLQLYYVSYFFFRIYQCTVKRRSGLFENRNRLTFDSIFLGSYNTLRVRITCTYYVYVLRVRTKTGIYIYVEFVCVRVVGFTINYMYVYVISCFLYRVFLLPSSISLEWTFFMIVFMNFYAPHPLEVRCTLCPFEYSLAPTKFDTHLLVLPAFGLARKQTDLD